MVPVLDGRPNIIARLRGTEGHPVVVLNGHIDTVPSYNMQDAFRRRRLMTVFMVGEAVI